ncbi:TVP38/TMEM64 family protein [Desulfitobacterium sp. AusDCA]|uniref:TVP38/TMEM64 family protein n=1 Tax=Desulfitobacterium sp. AusDCA TaxID=3240383 RepID=UPI003DA70ADD
MKNKRKMFVIIKTILLSLFVLAIIFVTIKYAPYVTELVKTPDRFKDLLASYGHVSIIVFLGFQIMQVIIAAISGEPVQIAGGYVYGMFLGSVYSVIGIALGSAIAFSISRFLGYSLIRTFISQEKLEKFNFLINNPKSEIIMFVLFLLPGMPKDLLTYIAGLTPINPVIFLIISTVARFPALLVTSYIGANMQKGNYIIVAVVSVIALILFIMSLFTKDRIVAFLHKIKHKDN